MTKNETAITEFWKKYCESLNSPDQSNCLKNKPDSWGFGDSPEMADDLLNYVLTGEKTATSGMVLDFEHDGDPIPKIGDKSIILNGKDEPACIIEYTNVQLKKYNEVDKEFALKEAEGFKSLQDWQEVHWAFFSRRCEVLKVPLHDQIDLVCLEFKLIYP